MILHGGNHLLFARVPGICVGLKRYICFAQARISDLVAGRQRSSVSEDRRLLKAVARLCHHPVTPIRDIDAYYNGTDFYTALI